MSPPWNTQDLQIEVTGAKSENEKMKIGFGSCKMQNTFCNTGLCSLHSRKRELKIKIGKINVRFHRWKDSPSRRVRAKRQESNGNFTKKIAERHQRKSWPGREKFSDFRFLPSLPPCDNLRPPVHFGLKIRNSRKFPLALSLDRGRDRDKSFSAQRKIDLNLRWLSSV